MAAWLTSNDPEHLRSDQYRDSGNLQARASLHDRFSTNPTGWHRWVFDRIAIPPNAAVLELGGGPGLLWTKNRDRIPSGARFVLTDFSLGMVQEARRALHGHENLTFATIDAEALPFPAARFDVVIANHMLYHVANRRRCFAEITRVLRPGGMFYAATNGTAHLRELNGLISRVTGVDERNTSIDGFSLENGADQLRETFAYVTLERYPDGLEVTEPEPLVAYIRSAGGDVLNAAAVDSLHNEITGMIRRDGAVRITKDAGVFIAR